MATCERLACWRVTAAGGKWRLNRQCELSGPLSWALSRWLAGFSPGLLTFLLFIPVNARWQWSPINNPGKPWGSGG